MKSIICTLFMFLYIQQSYSQIEINIVYGSHGKAYVSGPGLNTGYEFKINNRFSTLSQIGGMWLRNNNDFIDGKYKCNLYQVSQLILYKLLSNPKFRIIPAFGINYNYIEWHAILNPPYNTLPIREGRIEFSKGWLKVTSIDNEFKDSYYESGLGLTFQLRTQFKINKTTWLNIAPFYSDTFSGGQHHGGGYIGVQYQFK